MNSKTESEKIWGINYRLPVTQLAGLNLVVRKNKCTCSITKSTTEKTGNHAEHSTTNKSIKQQWKSSVCDCILHGIAYYHRPTSHLVIPHNVIFTESVDRISSNLAAVIQEEGIRRWWEELILTGRGTGRLGGVNQPASLTRVAIGGWRPASTDLWT